MSTQHTTAGADDEGVCIRCHRSMHIPDGMDPTPMCCGCAHDALDETAAERDRLREQVTLLSAALKRADAVNADLLAALVEIVEALDDDQDLAQHGTSMRATIARARAQ